MLVAWSPTGSGRTAEFDLPVGTARVVRLEKMPLVAGEASRIPHTLKPGAVRFMLDESPTYFSVEE